jgi:hypothetical protein
MKRCSDGRSNPVKSGKIFELHLDRIGSGIEVYSSPDGPICCSACAFAGWKRPPAPSPERIWLTVSRAVLRGGTMIDFPTKHPWPTVRRKVKGRWYHMRALASGYRQLMAVLEKPGHHTRGFVRVDLTDPGRIY